MDAATNGGYVKLWRSWIDHPLFAVVPEAWGRVALVCLLAANWKPAKWDDGHTEIIIPRGSFVTSLDKLSAKARVSTQQARGALAYLKRSEFATSRATNRWRIITITNYESYQSDEAAGNKQDNMANNKPATSQQQAAQQQSKKEEKKGRREEEERETLLPTLLSSTPVPDLPDVDDPPFDPGTFPELTAAPPNGPRWGAAEKRAYFEKRFWPEVWLKRGKSAAETAFIKRASSEAVADALRAKAIEQGRLIKDDAQVDGHSILHVATWLNKKRDEDDWTPPQRSDGW